MKNFTQLKKNLKNDFSLFKKIQIAVLGDTATQFLTQAIRGMGYEYECDLNIFEAEFNQIAYQIFDLSSELYQFKPDIVILFQSSHKLLAKYNALSVEQQNTFAHVEIQELKKRYTTLSTNLNAKIIYYNYTEIDDAVFGSFANKTESSFLFQLRQLNYELMLEACKNTNLFLCDLSSLQNQVGKLSVFQPSIYINTEMVLSLDILPQVAAKTLDIISALYGQFKKCLILDLDNTLWGGIIGDDGIEHIQIGNLGIGKAFSELQYWVKKLKDRGIILAVCSKNKESVAKEPFEKHPDMVLSLKDIAVFTANWENKADNIRDIQSILNISFDSMVFLDDNPFERNFVREQLPQVCVPELPDDPADYLEYLYTLNIFETVSFSNVDIERTKIYQDEAKRNLIRHQFTQENDFLQSLNMRCLVEPFNQFNTPRVAQLSQRSNQFNLRTVRYAEDDIAMLLSSKNHFSFAFSLQDKFGDNGLICVIILVKESEECLFIDTWFMSCRVLKRGVEHYALNTVVATAKAAGFTYIMGEYLPTSKNEMVKDHYLNLGFEKYNEYWKLNINTYVNKKHCINDSHENSECDALYQELCS